MSRLHFNIKNIFAGFVFLCIAFVINSGCLGENVYAQTLNFEVETAAGRQASKLDINISSAGGQSCASLRDGSYSTSVSFSETDIITITSDTPIYGIYLIWDLPAVEWTLSYKSLSSQSISKTCGTNGFLHEYVSIPDGAVSCTVNFSKSARISDIFCYGNGSLPNDVQIWQPSCEKADMLVFSTHADDEILFLGGPLVTYGSSDDVDVQVVYMCEFWSTQKVREHEKLDGLWECGIRHYPVSGNFKDLYSMSLEAAMQQYDYNDLVKFLTEQIRRFKPQVCVTQDLNGEYGHGGHRILVKAFCEAVDNCGKTDFCPDSVKTYGKYDVPKAYLHLYEQGKINLNLRTPIAALDNRTGLDVLKSAYKKHVSQQGWWFYVSDEYQYSCASFGLYRTTVGADTGNDMLEHIVTYKTQAELAAKAEQERIEASVAASIAEAVSIDESIKESEREAKEAQLAEEAQRKARNLRLIIAVCAVIAIAGVITVIIAKYRRKHTKNLLKK